MLRSIKLHIQYLRSLEDSERVRKACVRYMQVWYENFYPDCPDMSDDLQALAAQLHGHLSAPRLRWKYAWMEPILGWKAARWSQNELPQLKSSLAKRWDRALYRLEAHDAAENRSQGTPRVADHG